MTHRDRIRDRDGGFPRLSGSVTYALRCPASPQRTLLAENLGKPSLWVIINAPWYNVFGQVDIKPTGEMAKLLKKIGVTNLTLPLNGKFSSSAFASHDASAIKNQIFNNLDLKIASPTLAMPGLSKVANIRHSVLSLKGIIKNGTRGIDAKIDGELDVTIGSKKLVLDYDLEVIKKPV